MAVGFGLDCRARILFQRQWENPSAIEMHFEEILGLNVAPSKVDYESIIYAATFQMVDGVFYWASRSGWSPDGEDKNEATWIAAHKVKWRDASDWMGDELKYRPEV